MLTTFVATKDNMNRIVNYVGHWRLSTHSSISEDALVASLLSKSTVIANIDGADGIIILENIRPSFDGNMATVSFLFWDRIIRTKIEAMHSALEEAMNVFDIGRMTALVPERNFQLGICYLKIGFLREGRMRKFLIDGQDCLVFGLLKSDLLAYKRRISNVKEDTSGVELSEPISHEIEQESSKSD